jgi:protein TonB
MSATLHAFPAAHSFNSPRSWAMAVIVVIHLGFFWLLTSGMGRSLLILPPPQTAARIIDSPLTPPPKPVETVDPVVRTTIYTPPLMQPKRIEEFDEVTPPQAVSNEVGPLTSTVESKPTVRAPVEVMPEIDPRRGLSEPVYPASMIRQGIEGTEVLAIQVLENGRVVEVRVERSSGESKLDESAAREARRWRFIPGTRDGVPVALWKQVPVTFRLQDRQ